MCKPTENKQNKQSYTEQRRDKKKQTVVLQYYKHRKSNKSNQQINHKYWLPTQYWKYQATYIYLLSLAKQVKAIPISREVNLPSKYLPFMYPRLLVVNIRS